MTTLTNWQVEGSYFEGCNCEAVCPCRRQGDRPGGRSTYGVCDFALSWLIRDGHADSLDLSGFEVVLAGHYDDDEPGQPWRVALYVDQRAEPDQQHALADIFLGRAGGTTLTNYAQIIGEVHAVRPARIRLNHSPGPQRIEVEDYVTVKAVEAVPVDVAVSCEIPGHDHPGTELRTSLVRVNDPPLQWEVSGGCGFTTEFVYRSDGPPPSEGS
ncbi:MAG: DUF1326 domain-containing protein [Actinomycetota bacterium]|nr:DUF1326 domain-containing protein [Actinomycetota bacterium]MDQ3529066.1 DUF1326 domain-containing protein [Actinomycetota bacterium]